MSYIIFDYQCDTCQLSYPDMFIKRAEIEKQRCDKCKGLLRRMPAGPTTTFKFGDRSAVKSKKAVSLRDRNPGNEGVPFSVD